MSIRRNIISDKLFHMLWSKTLGQKTFVWLTSGRLTCGWPTFGRKTFCQCNDDIALSRLLVKPVSYCYCKCVDQMSVGQIVFDQRRCNLQWLKNVGFKIYDNQWEILFNGNFFNLFFALIISFLLKFAEFQSMGLYNKNITALLSMGSIIS